MTHRKPSLQKLLDQAFARFQQVPPAPVDPAWERILERRRQNLEGAFDAEITEDSAVTRTPTFRRRPVWVAAAAALVFAVTLSMVFWPAQAPAVIGSAEGGLHRVAEGNVETLKSGEAVALGERIRSNGGSGGTLVLADGSVVEMRSKSELWLERAEDGILIGLSNGGIIVNAAKQGTGHLYVKTKDVTVTVVGTVFLVNAEEEGSRVAVIEGEVRVKQGTAERKLGPGDQVLTNAWMETQPVTTEVSWSRNAGTHLAMLQQSQPPIQISPIRLDVDPSATQQTTRSADIPKWESVYITACGDSSNPGTRGGMGTSKGPLRVTCMPVKWLIERAYVKWTDDGVIRPDWFFPISGGPSWLDSENYTIEATPAGSPTDQMMRGPMLQALLEDRFKLKIRREIREEPVYELRVAESGSKLQPLKDGECAARDAAIDAKVAAARTDKMTLDEQIMARMNAGIFPCGMQAIGGPLGGLPAPPSTRTVNVVGGGLDLLIRNLSLDRIVIDKTGLKGLYDIQLTYGIYTSPMREPKTAAPDAPYADSIFTTIQKLGLNLVPVNGPRTYFIIDHAEHPQLK